MSHLKERKEKNCLNCGADLIGRYCHVCGQENLEPKETVWHLVSHFFNDITHFDGKFFATVKYLLRKPGFLSLEYIKGRRMSYLNPIRMYVFTSAFFFIVLFALKSSDTTREKPNGDSGPKNLAALKADLPGMQQRLATETDDDDKADIRDSIRDNSVEIAAIKQGYGDTSTRLFRKAELDTMLFVAYTDSLTKSYMSAKTRKNFTRAVKHLQTHSNSPGGRSYAFYSGDHEYKTVEAYDSAERALPDSLRDGWFKHWITSRNITMNEEYREDPRLFNEHIKENILHSFPKILFVSLPIFALILNILYFRHKHYYYVDHGIFTIHVYCATFILLLLAMLISKLDSALDWGWFHIVSLLLIIALSIYMMIYLYKAMRGFYLQRRGKTFLKYFITFCVAGLINSILTVIFILISVFSM